MKSVYITHYADQLGTDSYHHFPLYSNRCNPTTADSEHI